MMYDPSSQETIVLAKVRKAAVLVMLAHVLCFMCFLHCLQC